MAHQRMPFSLPTVVPGLRWARPAAARGPCVLHARPLVPPRDSAHRLGGRPRTTDPLDHSLGKMDTPLAPFIRTGSTLSVVLQDAGSVRPDQKRDCALIVRRESPWCQLVRQSAEPGANPFIQHSATPGEYE
jgi:hypothetical protein